MNELPIEQRFARLKKHNRLLRRQLAQVQRRQSWLAIAGAISLILLVAVGAANVSGDHFELLHPQTQHTRISFYGGPTGKSAGFKFLDDSGNLNAFLGTSPQNAPQLQYFAADGSTRAEFDLDGSGVPALKMYGANGKLRSKLFEMPQGKSAMLNFFDDAGNDRFNVGIGDDSPGISFRSAEGKMRGSLSMNPQGKTEALQFMDGDGRPRLLAALEEQAYLPSVQLFSANGKVRLVTVVQADDSTGLMIYDNVVANKNPRLFIGCDNKGEPVIEFMSADGQIAKKLTP